MSMLPKLVLRDLALLALALLLLRGSHQLQAAEATLALPLAALAGVALTVAGYLAHEWGHLLGALAAGSRVELPARLAAVFLFRFDSGRNSRRQFLAMSMGGFISSAAVVALLLLTLSMHWWADRIALGLVLLGVVATFILEVPGAWRVYKGAPLPRGAAFVDGGPAA